MSASASHPLFDRLLEAHAAAAADFARLLRHVPEAAGLTTGGQWTLRECGVHMVGFHRLYRSFLAGYPSPITIPADLEVINAGFFLALDENRPEVLADLLMTATSEFSADARRFGEDHPCPMHFGLILPARALVAIMTMELLLHGWDIAAATSQSRAADGAATPVVEHFTPQFPLYMTPPLGDQTIALCTEGLVPTVYRFVPGTVEPEVWADDGDYGCTLAGPPLAVLLMFFGWPGWAEAGLVVSGDRPDLAESFRFAPPV